MQLAKTFSTYMMRVFRGAGGDWFAYDGSDSIGVFSTKDKAIAAVEARVLRNRSYESWTEKKRRYAIEQTNASQ